MSCDKIRPPVAQKCFSDAPLLQCVQESLHAGLLQQEVGVHDKYRVPRYLLQLLHDKLQPAGLIPSAVEVSSIAELASEGTGDRRLERGEPRKIQIAEPVRPLRPSAPVRPGKCVDVAGLVGCLHKPAALPAAQSRNPSGHLPPVQRLQQAPEPVRRLRTEHIVHPRPAETAIIELGVDAPHDYSAGRARPLCQPDILRHLPLLGEIAGKRHHIGPKREKHVSEPPLLRNAVIELCSSHLTTNR